MSNTNDPHKPTPGQPDPNAPKPPADPPQEYLGANSSFEFLLPDEVGSYSELPPIPEPDEIGSKSDFGALPPPPQAGPRDASFDFINMPGSRGSFGDFGMGPLPAPVPPVQEPPALVPTQDAILLPDLPAVPEPPPVATGAESWADLGIVPPVPTGPDGDSFIGLGAAVPGDAPSSFALGSIELPAPEPAPEPSSIELPAVDASALNIGELPDPPDSSGSTPRLSKLFPEAKKGGGASFEFRLPGSLTDLPPIPQPDALGSADDFGALPPPPPAVPRGTSFEFINVPGSQTFADLPSHPPAQPVPDSTVGLGNLEPVAPASGWLDGDEAPAAPAVPNADVFDLPVDAVVESSDIFTGGSVRPAEPVETSDVLSATSGAAPAAEPVRPSEVALTFNEPDGDFSDLPVADDVLDSATDLLAAGRGDDESIHDAPEPGSNNPLFDSATLADARDLPANPDADATDYGAAPAYSADASSILADLSRPDLAVPADSSSVRVEAPGVDRTLTGEPADGAFDLTLEDEPVPADLLDQLADPDSEPTDWKQQSGSDLLAQGRTAAPGDTEGMVDPVDADLFGEQPSLSSAPSSIFSGTKHPTTSESNDSGHAEIGGGVEELTEAVELVDEPEPDVTIERAPLPSAPRRKVPNLSSGDFELPPTPAVPLPDGAIDWDAAPLADDESSTRGVPRDADLTALLKDQLPDDSDEMPTRTSKPVAARADTDAPPEVSVDWLAGSAEGPPVAAEPPRPKPGAKDKAKPKPVKATAPAPEEPPARTKPAKVRATRPDPDTETATKPDKPAKKGGGMVVGALVGAVLAGGAFAGVYFGGVIPNSDKGAPVPPVTQKPGTGDPGPSGPGLAPAAFDPRAAFATGDTAKATEHFKANPPTTTADKAVAGYIGVFAKVQTLPSGESAKADDAELKAARESLQAVLDDEAAAKQPGGDERALKTVVALGVSHEVAGDTKSARKVYADAIEKLPKYKAYFEAHINRLDAQDAPAAGGTSRRLTPADAERLLLGVALLLQDDTKTEATEPGVSYWKAVKLANGGDYAGAIKEIETAKKAHLARAKAVAGRGLNPLSDPLEQIFTKSCDELKAHWELKGAIYGNPAVAAAIKKDGLPKALDSFTKAADAVVKAEKEATAARDTVKKLETDVAKAEKEAKAYEKEAKAFEKEAKAFEKDKLDAEAKLKTATDNLKTAGDDLKAAEKKLETAVDKLKVAEKDVLAQKDVLAMLVETLKPVTPIPDEWKAADLLAATKAVVSRATGPDLKALVPNAMQAIGGGGLTTGQLLDIADRLTKAEAAAKAATAKLATETKTLTDKYETETKKLKDDHAGELKKLTDTYTTEAKKLKDGSAEELKKLTDKFAADAKKATDDYATATAALKDAHAAALKDEQAKTEAEKKRSAAREIEFQKQLGSAVTPGQVMDIWLPRLTDLRRVADTAPALGAAEKAIAGSSPDSEDRAKAVTVAGLAYLIRGDLASAKEAFQIARNSPAYKSASGKPWAVAADNGLDAVSDPAAPYRQPVVVPPIDLKAAAASLDVGIVAYKSGRYADAVKALLDAAKNNPADPVAWYFLGAARWATGDEEQAKKDFAQGAEREKVSPVPNRTLSAALAPLQGAVRDVVDRTRP